VRILRAADRARVPWRNGAGTTTEVALDGEPDAPSWRLSIATIQGPSAFSGFPGYDRMLMPLDDSLLLDIDGAETTVPRHSVVRFRGEQRVSAVAVASPQSDLNLFVARDRFRGSLGSLEVAERLVVPPARGLQLIVVLTPGLDSAGWPLHLGDAIDPVGDTVCLEGSGAVAIATIVESTG
jgi:environmental stress-induced protein Ves